MQTPEYEPFLLRDPSVSRTHIAFSYGGCIWISSHDGEELRRLTTAGRESKPAISPDGTCVAFVGEYGGPRGVFVMPINGGEPRRLTFHPADLSFSTLPAGDTVAWTPDGTRILFSSRRASSVGPVSGVQLFTVASAGGAATAIPLARAVQGTFSSDERRIAYVPHLQIQRECKRYRGGQTRFIVIADVGDSSIVARIPRDGSNDFNPIWIGETIYFLSDRSGPVTLFAYDLKSQKVRQVVKNEGLDIKAASAISDTIVYERFGALHLLDVKSGRDRKLDIRPVADFPEVCLRFENAAEFGVTEGHQEKLKAKLSPTGARVVFGVRGRIVTVPAKKGDVRVLTQHRGVAERDPAWSPDGKSIAYFSDESGEYALHTRDPSGLGGVRKIDLGHPPTFYYSPIWSPDSGKIAYGDRRLNYSYVDLRDGRPVHFDTALFVHAARGGGDPYLRMAWSPDSRWIAYIKELPNHLHAVFVHSIEKGESTQLTDGVSDVRDVAFDRGGQYLYFTASTDVALSGEYLDMNSYRRPVTRSVHAMLLRRDSPTPLPLESDEEQGQVSTDSLQRARTSDNVPAVELDLEQIGQRIVCLPLPNRNYYGLWAGRPGVIFLTEGPQVEDSNIGGSLFGYLEQKVHRFDLSTRRSEQILDDAVYFELSFDGDKMLYAKQHEKRQWFITAAEKLTDPTANMLKMDPIDILVDPRAEWRQMYHEVCRQVRDFFYDPGLHGLDFLQFKRTYEPFLAHIVTREELEYLFNEMLANLTCLHMGTLSGELAKHKRSTTGLLGADYAIENGRYRFFRIYESDPWSAEVRSPLRESGKSVQVGEYLLAVNDREVSASADVYSYFAGTAGKQVVIKVGPRPDGSGSREITVTPVEDEYPLRHFAWVEGNRRRVSELTDGRVAYIHLSNLGSPGYAAFNRQFFAQVGKDAAIVDNRYNSGGSGADYIVESLRRPLLNYWHLREGRDRTHPMMGIFGPKVMLINETSCSMGERLPWLFREVGVGPLIGTRTWGGLVGYAVNAPDLMDGGYILVPNLAFYNLQGAWEIENQGVSPDIEVEDDPKGARSGHDLQLERAVEVVMDLLKKNPSPSRVPQHPPYPNYYSDN